jgi:hypothetical protein
MAVEKGLYYSKYTKQVPFPPIGRLCMSNGIQNKALIHLNVIVTNIILYNMLLITKLINDPIKETMRQKCARNAQNG